VNNGALRQFEDTFDRLGMSQSEITDTKVKTEINQSETDSYDLMGLSSIQQPKTPPLSTTPVINMGMINNVSIPFGLSSEWKVGDVVSDAKNTKTFKLIEQLGEGSYGTVFRVKQLETNVQYALKRITINDYQEKEVKLMMMLDHENIVKYYDSFMDKNRRYYCILMEYCSGKHLDGFIQDLNEIMKQSNGIKILTMDVRFSWFIKLLGVLSYLHQNKVIHRDLKPQNIIVQYDKEKLKNNFEEEIRNITMKIIDFGLAKQLVHKESTSTVCGTRAYIAPEMKTGSEYDYKVDVYSLGIIFMQVSSGLSAKDFQHLIGERARRHNMEFWAFIRSPYYFNFIHDHVFDIGSKRIVKMMVCSCDERKNAAELLDHPILRTWRFVFENDSSQLYYIMNKPESILGFLSGLDTSSLTVRRSILGMRDLMLNNKLTAKCCELILEYRVLPVLLFYVARKLFSANTPQSDDDSCQFNDEIFNNTLSIISQVLVHYDSYTDKQPIKRIIREMRNETSLLQVDELGRFSTTCILSFIHSKISVFPDFFYTMACLRIVFLLCKYDKSTRVGYCVWLEKHKNKIGKYNIPLSDEQISLLRGISTYLSLIEPGYSTLLSLQNYVDPFFVEAIDEIPFHHRKQYIKQIWAKLNQLLTAARDRGDEQSAEKVLTVMNHFLYDYHSLERFTTFGSIGNNNFTTLSGDSAIVGLPNSLYYWIPVGRSSKKYAFVDRQTAIYHLLYHNVDPSEIKVHHFQEPPSNIYANEKEETLNQFLGSFTPVPLSPIDFSHLYNVKASPLTMIDNERTFHFFSKCVQPK